MPSRKKKALRDAAITRSFFNRSESTAGSSSAEQSHSQATDSKASSELNASAERLRSKMYSFWDKEHEKLTGEKREEAQKDVERLPVISDPHRVVQELNLAQKTIKGAMAKNTEVTLRKSFKLDDLGQAVEQYEHSCQTYKDRLEYYMAKSTKDVSNFTSIAGDTTRSTEDRINAGLDAQKCNIEVKIRAPLESCLRQLQLLNIEKKAGCFMESLCALAIEDEEKLKDFATYVLLSFRQKLTDPFKPIEPAPEPGQNQGKENLSCLEALAQLQRNLKLASEELQNIKAINNTQELEEVPSVTTTLMYRKIPIPEDIPDHVRQRFLDASFARDQVEDVKEKISKQLVNVRSTLTVWHSASHEVWEISKIFRYEMRDFREYEYNRTTFGALLSIRSWQEVKIVEFYSGEGAPEFPLAMRKLFKIGSMSFKEFKKHWERRYLRMHDRFPSVDTIIADLESTPA